MSAQEIAVKVAKLIGLLDDAGILSWTWFGDPLDETLSLPPERRKYIAELLGLIDEGAVAEDFGAEGRWVPFDPVNEVAFGPAWTKQGNFELGLGARVELGLGEPGQELGLRVLVGLLEIIAGDTGNFTEVSTDVNHALGQITLTGTSTLPVDFINTLALDVELDPEPVRIGLTVTDSHGRSCELNVDPNDLGQLALDFGRLGMFVVTAWLHQAASTGSEVLQRLDQHLLPLFGGCGLQPSPIGRFPVFDGDLSDQAESVGMGQPADFGFWADSLTSTANDASGPMTALWHLRALITGDTDRNFLDGSCWVPLSTSNAAPGAPLSPESLGPFDPELLTDFPEPAPDGAWIGVEQQGDQVALILRLTVGGQAINQDLVRVDTNTRALMPAQVADFSPLSQSIPPVLTEHISITPAGSVWIFELHNFGFTGPDTHGWSFVVQAEVETQGTPGVELVLVLNDVQDPIWTVRVSDTLEVAPPNLDLIFKLISAGNPSLEALGTLLADILEEPLEDPNKTPDLKFSSVTGLISALLGQNSAEFTVGQAPVTVEFSAGTGELIVAPKLSLAIPAPSGDFPILVGGIEASVEIGLGLEGASFRGLSLDFKDLRLGSLGGGAEGLVAELLPDLRDIKGLDLGVSWSGDGPPSLRGGARIPIQQVVGPIEISTIEFAFDEDSFDFGVDAELSLGGIIVAPYGLGFRVPFAGDASPEFRLDGLGLSFDAGGVRLTGMFLNTGQDFLGAAVLSCFGLFELTAIGGYAELPMPKSDKTSASLFVFAALDAPIGGAPWCFVTGLAAGFGYNRTLPKDGKPSDNAFLRVMKGEPIDTTDATAMRKSLESIGKQFTPKLDQYWVAAGLEFTSFGLIHGKLVLALGFGKSFSLNLLGTAAFGLKPIAYFELDFQATVDAEHFKLVAELSRNSYIIHPDLFGIHGGFGLAVWYAGPNAGEFVLTIGGYHPAFPVPEHFPKVDRIGVKATVYGFIKFSVDGYFAITPRAMMAGAAASLSAEFVGIEAGLSVYVDVLIQWDPFYIEGRMGVAVWFYFLGRHEISVELTLWTPPLGGRALIDLDIVSFEISFGSKRQTKRLQFHEFLERQLELPATAGDADKVLPTPFAGADAAGLLAVDIPWGRAARGGEGAVEGQAGLSRHAPIEVEPEFGLTLRSKIPAGRHPTMAAYDVEPAEVSETEVGHVGSVDFPLCRYLDDLESRLSITIFDGDDQPVKTLSSERVQRWLIPGDFPEAQFGAPFEGAQAGGGLSARAIAAKEGSEPSIYGGVAGLGLDFALDLPPDSPVINAKSERSTSEERYPLPLGPRGGRGREAVVSKTEGPIRRRVSQRVARKLSRRGRVLRTLGASTASKASMTKRALAMSQIELPRGRRLTRLAGALPARVPRIPVPASPARGAALAGVELRVVEAPRLRAHRVTRERRGALRLPKLQGALPRSGPALASFAKGRGVAAAGGQRVDLPAGKVSLVELAGPREPAARGRLVVAGRQRVRAVFLGRRGGVRGQRWLSGRGVLDIPRGTWRVLLIGEGEDSPVDAGSGRAVEAVGVEAETLLIAAGPDTLIAAGCALVFDGSLDESPAELDLLAGESLFEAMVNARVHFPAVGGEGKEASLVLELRPRVASPGSLDEQLGGASEGATLGGPSFVHTDERVAVVFPLRCAGAWSFELELGPDWEASGVVALPQASAEVLARLRGDPGWDLVDDRQTTCEPTNSTIRLELEA